MARLLLFIGVKTSPNFSEARQARKKETEGKKMASTGFNEISISMKNALSHYMEAGPCDEVRLSEDAEGADEDRLQDDGDSAEGPREDLQWFPDEAFIT